MNSFLMLYKLLETSGDYVFLFIRLIAGIIILPYGIQKLFKVSGGRGLKGTLNDLTVVKNIPVFIAWLIIGGQSLGAIALIIGFLARVAAAGNVIIFTGALIVHGPDGWSLNWFNKKKGEGIEYFILLLTLLLIVVFRGSGPLSLDYFLSQK